MILFENLEETVKEKILSHVDKGVNIVTDYANTSKRIVLMADYPCDDYTLIYEMSYDLQGNIKKTSKPTKIKK